MLVLTKALKTKQNKTPKQNKSITKCAGEVAMHLPMCGAVSSAPRSVPQLQGRFGQGYRFCLCGMQIRAPCAVLVYVLHKPTRIPPANIVLA